MSQFIKFCLHFDIISHILFAFIKFVTMSHWFTFVLSNYSHEVEKFARNTGLKLFRTSVKENLNIGRVFQHLAERHIESVSRWSDESADEFSQPILQIGHHQTRDVRVRFANEHELNDRNSHSSSKGIAVYHRGFKPNGCYYSNGSSNANSSSNSAKSDRIILNPFKWSKQMRNNAVNKHESSQSQGKSQNFYAHHPRYYQHHHSIHVQNYQPQQQQKPSCRMIWTPWFIWLVRKT